MIYLIISVAVILADLVSKIMVANGISLGAEIAVIPGVLNITNLSNDGIAFGMMGDMRWLFMTVTVIVMVALLLFVVTAKDYSRMVYVIAALILGGGIGNFIDRIVSVGRYDLDKAVVDFIDFCAFPKIWRYTFNLADVAVCVGVGLFILYLVAFDKKAYKNGYKAVMYEEKKNAKE